MLDLSISCSEDMSTHTRAREINLSVCATHIWLVPTPYANFDMLAPNRHGGFITKNFVAIASLRENIFSLVFY
jgi:hypothetical protein